MSGCLLVFHLGSGPGRSDKFHAHFGELLDYLVVRGYRLVAVDELLNPQAGQERLERVAKGQRDRAISESMRRRTRRWLALRCGAVIRKPVIQKKEGALAGA